MLALQNKIRDKKQLCCYDLFSSWAEVGQEQQVVAWTPLLYKFLDSSLDSITCLFLRCVVSNSISFNNIKNTDSLGMHIFSKFISFKNTYTSKIKEYIESNKVKKTFRYLWFRDIRILVLLLFNKFGIVKGYLVWYFNAQLIMRGKDQQNKLISWW